MEAAQPALDYPAFDWLRRAALSDAVAWDREFGRVRDVSKLGIERNLFRYRPVEVSVRAAPAASLQEVLRVAIAGVRAGGSFTLSLATGLPAGVGRILSDAGVAVHVESDDEWIARVSASGAPRARLVGSRDAVADLHRHLAQATGGSPDLAVYDNEVTTAGRLELLPFVHEQSVTITAHRFGNPDAWSESVI
jgi:RHH-type proline utilization regulon transcriptional repressor/proline dehydrogenase/delta 1-pyrroline-5-carboxylate dehydrogenase